MISESRSGYRQWKYSAALVLLFLISLIIGHVDASAEADSNSTIPLITAHPAMFGSKWTSIVNAEIKIVTLDLCNSSLLTVSNTDNVFDNGDTNLTAFGLYYDPTEKTGKQECLYAEMAQVAERLYPTAQYLVFAADHLATISTPDDIPNPDLKVGVITFEDGQAITTGFGGQNATSPGTGAYQVQLDGISRYIFDIDESLDADIMFITNLRWLPRVSGLLSLIGSLYVMFNLIGTKERRKKNLRSRFNQLLLVISTGDVMSSTMAIVGGLMIPKTPPGAYEGYYSQSRWDFLYPEASGSRSLCSAQGFFLNFGLFMSISYTCFMSIQTLLVVRYAWGEQKMKRVERVFPFVGIGIPFIQSLFAAIVGVFNPLKTGICWYERPVLECDMTESVSGDVFEEYCESTGVSEALLLINFFLAMGSIIFCFMVISTAMILLFLFVRQQEQQSSMWSYNDQEGRQQKKVLTKAIQYISFYVLTFFPVIVSYFLLNTDTSSHADVINYVAAVFSPLQGFFNGLIYAGIVEKWLQKLCCGFACCFGSPRNPQGSQCS